VILLEYSWAVAPPLPQTL